MVKFEEAGKKEGNESLAAGAGVENRAVTFGPSVEAIVERNNLRKALAQSKRNKRAPGIDAVSVGDLTVYHKDPLPRIRPELFEGGNQVQPVRRVTIGVEAFLERRLRLKVNRIKNEVSRPLERKFLGFSFTNQRNPRRRIAPAALARFKGIFRKLMRRTKGARPAQIVEELSRYLSGSRGPSGFCEMPSVLRALDKWSRRRLRAIAWKHRTRGNRRFAELRKAGVGKNLAAKIAGSSREPLQLSNSWTLAIPLPNPSSDQRASAPSPPNWLLDPTNCRIEIRTSGGVGEEKARGYPLPILRASVRIIAVRFRVRRDRGAGRRQVMCCAEAMRWSWVQRHPALA